MAPVNQTAAVASTGTSTLSLYLPPSSPLFSYSPNTGIQGAAPNDTDGSLTGGWIGAASTPAGTGASQGGGWANNTSSQAAGGNVKQTSGNAAFMLNNVPLTSFTPLFDAQPGYSPTLQSSSSPPQPWVANQTYTQPFGLSSLTFSVPCTDPSSCPATPFVFRGAQLETEVAPPGGPTTSNVIADDASGLVEYTGWSPIAKNNAVVVAGSGDYGGTLSMSATANASAVVRFRATAVLLRGVTAPPLGRFTITLDSAPPQTFDARDEVTTHDVPLYFASALDGAAVHQLSLLTLPGSEEGAGTGAVIDRVEIWGPEGSVGFIGKDGNLVIPPTAEIPPNPGGVVGNGTAPGGTLPGATSGGAPSAGAIVGILIGVLAALLLLYYFFRKYGRPAPAKPAPNSVNKWDAANNLQAMKQEAVLVTTVAKQRYVYPGMIAHSDLK